MLAAAQLAVLTGRVAEAVRTSIGRRCLPTPRVKSPAGLWLDDGWRSQVESFLRAHGRGGRQGEPAVHGMRPTRVLRHRPPPACSSTPIRAGAGQLRPPTSAMRAAGSPGNSIKLRFTAKHKAELPGTGWGEVTGTSRRPTRTTRSCHLRPAHDQCRAPHRMTRLRSEPLTPVYCQPYSRRNRPRRQSGRRWYLETPGVAVSRPGEEMTDSAVRAPPAARSPRR